MTTAHLAELTRLIIQHGRQLSSTPAGPSDDNSQSLFIFIDGLDEGSGRGNKSIDRILGVVQDLETEPPLGRKIWISSRETFPLRQFMDGWPSITADDMSEVSVGSFLNAAVPDLGKQLGVGREIKGKPREHPHPSSPAPLCLSPFQCQRPKRNLTRRSRGMGAGEAPQQIKRNLSVRQVLREDVFTVDDILHLTGSRVPDKLSEIYTQSFRQYRPEQFKYTRYVTNPLPPPPFNTGAKSCDPSSLLYSLVAFARRPRRLREIQEAMTLSLSDSTRDFDPSMSPMALRRLFSGLIEMQDDPAGDPDNPLCRLCHSTLREFLEENAAILYLDSPNRTHSLTYTISRSAIGDLCLRYMSLDRYRELLNVTQTNLVEASFLQPGDSFDHALLPYCAKFWVRHLDDLAMTRSLQIWLMTFLTSSNFQTLLQAQSLFVDSQFELVYLLKKPPSGFRQTMWLRRPAFPRWFGDPFDVNDEDRNHARECWTRRLDYRHFVGEWGYLLERGTCQQQAARPYREHFFGEIDRCLSGLLGPTNFMNGMKERHPSFMLTTKPLQYRGSERVIVAERHISRHQYMALSYVA